MYSQSKRPISINIQFNARVFDIPLKSFAFVVWPLIRYKALTYEVKDAAGSVWYSRITPDQADGMLYLMTVFQKRGYYRVSDWIRKKLESAGGRVKISKDSISMDIEIRMPYDLSNNKYYFSKEEVY